MKIVFILRHSGYIRIFESTLRMLCERGHTVHVGLLITKERHWLVDTKNPAQQLSADYSNFSYSTAPIRQDEWGVLGATLRASSDYLRYLAPRYRNAPKLRERATDNVLPHVIRLTARGPFGSRLGLALVNASCRLLERCISVSAEIDQVLLEHRPDILLVSPLIDSRAGTPQHEYVRAARARNIPTVFCVASWDNLTNKGLIHGPMDLVTVWNDEMKREAVELHGVPPDRVAVTGAQVFDQWFDWQPSRSRDVFCARVGLEADQPYFLYLCSSAFIAKHETSFVRRWVQQLRESSSPALRRAGVLVRPHPQNEEQWRRFDARGLANFTVYPPAGAIPVDAASKADYFDSIYHSAATIGVNTTAEIESAIVGRRVFTLLAPEFRDTQEGTLHFHHLQSVGDGLLRAADNFSDHLRQLDDAIRDGHSDDGRCRRFVEAFVRPFGLDVPATPKLVEAIESVPSRPPLGQGAPPLVAPLLKPLLKRFAARVYHEHSLKLAEKEEERRLKRELKLQRRAQKHKRAEAAETV